jgi:hypothetical protein
MTTGYVYCLSNELMPGIVKIGMTTRKMEVRLSEANKRDTFKPPTLFVVEIAKKVLNPKEKEQTLHTILTHLGKRVKQKREFFNASVDDVKLYFDLMDGELWQPNYKVAKKNIKKKIEYIESDNETDTEYESASDFESDSEPESSSSLDNIKATFTRIKSNKHLLSSNTIKKYKAMGKKGCRELHKCLDDGQKIRHVINTRGKKKILYGKYDKTRKTIEYDNKRGSGVNCSTLTEFVEAHYDFCDLEMTDNAVWRQCECKIKGEWISME